ncbi:MAG: hypothetical protein ACUVRV_12020 [Cyanobacteriota bacterium]
MIALALRSKMDWSLKGDVAQLWHFSCGIFSCGILLTFDAGNLSAVFGRRGSSGFANRPIAESLGTGWRRSTLTYLDSLEQGAASGQRVSFSLGGVWRKRISAPTWGFWG